MIQGAGQWPQYWWASAGENVKTESNVGRQLGASAHLNAGQASLGEMCTSVSCNVRGMFYHSP